VGPEATALTVFVDSSAWYAALDAADAGHVATATLLNTHGPQMMTDHVLVETWLLVARRLGYQLAEAFVREALDGGVVIEIVSRTDIEKASEIALAFPDQTFSIVDRTSFAVMERLGITQAISLDDDFLVYRYGRDRRRAFEVLR
jgi:predicted nucleic acid-binding protein